MAFLQIKNLSKEFAKKDGRTAKVLDGINLDIRKKEFIAVFGPNGCGKTTLLKILAGFEKATAGEAFLRKKPVEDAKSYLVFQNSEDSLFNWMNVRQNIEIALNDTAKNENVEAILKEMHAGGKDLMHFSEHYPYQLSGGLKQLTVLARAMAFNPELLLLDEPFSSLDFKTAMQMEDSLLEIWEKTKKTVLFVSHHVEEAVYLADKVVVLSEQPTKVRKIIDVGLPRPRNQSMKLSLKFQEIKRKILEQW